MLNQVVLVGRLVKDPKIMETEKGNKLTYVTLAVPRSYKNIHGEYETDFIDCTLWKGIAETTTEYCKKGDVVGIRGRLETSVYEKDGNKVYAMNIIAEKVNFLSSKKNDTTQEETEETDD